MSNQAQFFPQSYMYKLVPFVNITAVAAGNTNTKFNTNIPIGKVMLIRRIRDFFLFGASGTTIDTANKSNILSIAQLTENITATVVSATDPLSLHTQVAMSTNYFATAVGVNPVETHGFTDTSYMAPGHPGVPTLAQQLNVVLSNSQILDSNTGSSFYFLEIYFQLIDVDQAIKDFLANRIFLQRA